MENKVNQLFEDNTNGRIDFNSAKPFLDELLASLNDGTIRVANKQEGNEGTSWHINSWVQKAILLQLALRPATANISGGLPCYDKLPLKYQDYDQSAFEKDAVRVVPGALIRSGCYLAPKVVAMPCFVNIGAYVDEGTMLDTWSTVGSAGQIGKRVHLSGGAGIGGVLEPLGASPTIIEDNCFIGARSEIVEGVQIGEGSVIAMGVFIGKSTKIYNRETRALLPSGIIPPHSVVVPGTLSAAKHSEEKDVCQLGAAIIIKQVDAKTRSKTSINELLRD